LEKKFAMFARSPPPIGRETSKLAIHHIGIGVAQLRMKECVRQLADDSEAMVLPEADRALIGS
jgi:hypothetical protein